ncbi:MAG: ECF transporter S component [Firmicutes bacterium]|nr:ECF transporter S component [Bacillota bacterium]
MEKNKFLSHTISLRYLAIVGLLSALTYLLYLPILRIPVILFLEINLSEIVMFIGGFSLGPIAAIFLGGFRFLFSLPFSTTGGIGEFADLIYSLVFVLPGAWLYQRSRTKQTAMVGFIVGFLLQITTTSLMNALWITDLYLELFLNITPEAFLGYIQSAIPQVTNPYWSLVLWMYIPFNTFKNMVIIALTLISYKRLHRLIKQFKLN